MHKRVLQISCGLGFSVETVEQLERILAAIILELNRADLKHPPMDGCEEGIETLRCEVQELNREVKRLNRDDEAMLKEAVQVGAMAVKFMRDCCKAKP
jgi:hypothetical protein